MAITAKLRYLRISPRKVRLVADLIRGKKVEDAQAVLGFAIKKAAESLNKLLKSAVAGAKDNFQLNSSELYISKITVDQGPKYKRWRARSRGRACEIQKKTSHITIILKETAKGKKKSKVIEKSKKVSAKSVKTVEKIEKTSNIKEDGKTDSKTHAKRLEKETLRLKSKRGEKRVYRRKAF